MTEEQESPLTGRRKTDSTDDSVRLRKGLRWGVWMVLTGVILWQGLTISHSQKQYREANERLFRIVHGSPIATIMCDEDAKIVEYSRAAEELLGWTRDEMLGKDVNMLIAPSYREQHATTFKKAVKVLRAAEEDWRVTKTGMLGEALDKEGHTVKVMFSTRGIKYGDKIEFLALIRREAPIPKIESGPLELPKKVVP